jgi:zinc transport system permease protein
MSLWSIITNPGGDIAIVLPGILTALAVVLMCSLLSPLVVIKRLGFIGQGISHSAFGGIGVAAVLAYPGLMIPGLMSGPWHLRAGSTLEFWVIVLFCAIAALGMAAVSRRRTTPEDTAIGIFLVGSMALGALLVEAARSSASAARARFASEGLPLPQALEQVDFRTWESILFGSVYVNARADVVLAYAVLAGVLATLVWLRRPMAFWALDEETAKAFGVPTAALRTGLMLVLALVVVTSMKTTGVILATALLVLPGAIALRLSRRLGAVWGLSLTAGLLGLIGGIELSLQRNWPPGPCIVAVLAVLFAAAVVLSALQSLARVSGSSEGRQPAAS